MRSEAQALALAWRMKATQLQGSHYQKRCPSMVLAAVTTLETCAEELEDLVKVEIAQQSVSALPPSLELRRTGDAPGCGPGGPQPTSTV